MRIDILTLFPDMCKTVLGESIIGRACEKGVIDIQVHNIRDYSTDKHKKVDDTPYGGGMGMVMQIEPVYNCVMALKEQLGFKPHLIYLSPKGAVFNQKKAEQLSVNDNIALLCGHYEGIDERIIELLVDEEISVGDYVLTGGELPALIITDAVARLIPGVLPDEQAHMEESFSSGLLEYPQYTRPPEFMGLSVPEVLLSGHHLNIEKWRKEQAEKITKERRPDLLK